MLGRIIRLAVFTVFLGLLGPAAILAQTTTYDESFTSGVGNGPGSTQWDNWITFRSGAPASGIESVTVNGSLDSTGRTCSTPASAQTIMDNLRTGATATVSCGGNNWNTGTCGSGTELNVGSVTGVCACSANYTVRPTIGDGNANWGGVNSATCNGPTQTMTVNYSTTAAGSLTVTNTNDSGTGSLRDAITFANANAAEDDITFAIPSGGVHTIALTSALPDLTDNGINIDGTTQTGASCGQLTTGTQHTILIELNGAGAGVGTHALTATGDNITLKGLSIYGFGGRAVSQDTTASLTVAECLYIGLHADGTTLASNTTTSNINPSVRAYGATFTFDNSVIAAADGDLTDDALSIDGVNGATITGNLIGLKADGTTDGSISDIGINVKGTSTSILIGGATAATRNVVANAGGQGVIMTASGTGTIIGNYIGTDRTGLVAKGNHDEGIRVADGTITIGGTGAGEGNVISATTADDGIFLTSASVDVTILGNLIGVGSDGTTAMGNSSSGIDVGANATTVQIGDGTAAGSNVIKNNGDDGVELTGSSAAAIVANEIYNNGNMAIELVSGANHNLNDVNDVDTGGNDILNYPEFNSVSTNGATTIDYDFDLDVPSHGNGYRIDFFKNTAADSTGSGEGEVHLGFVDIVHGGGDLNFTGSFTASTTVDVGSLIAATTTRKTGASSYDITSEYSVNDTTTSSADPLIVTNTNDSGAGSLRDAITYANANATEDDITFAIPGAGVHIISPLTELPFITDDNVSLDGTSQTGAVCNTLVTGTPHVLKIHIDGANTTDAEGLYINATGVSISGVSITGFDSRAIRVAGPSVTTSIDCSYIGVNPDGTTKNANARSDGVGSVVVLSGDDASLTRSVVSGNDDDAGDSAVFISAANAVLTGNIIGLLADGTAALGNSNHGLHIRPTATALTIGGATASDRNIVSGNGGNGFNVDGSSNVSILGNYIGVDVDGLAALPNNEFGINMDTVGNITVGGASSGARNIISGNKSGGIISTNGSSTKVIQNNYIGVDVTGIAALRNEHDGIEMINESGTVSIIDNVVSANNDDLGGANGIHLDDGTFTLTGNKIGVGADGTTVLPNQADGVRVIGSSFVTLGDGTLSGANAISENLGPGMRVLDSAVVFSNGNRFEGNGAEGVVVPGSATFGSIATIFSENTDLPIDLGNDGVTANDENDIDTGANELLNFPEINGFTSDGATAVTYDFDLDVPNNPTHGYRIDFFKNTAGDASGYGEGEIFLGFIDIVHAGGDLNFTGSFTASETVSVGNIISATTTRKTGASTYDITSEFASNETAISAADPLIVTSTADTDTLGTLRYAINYANANAAADAITFDIPGAGPHTIALASPLPTITDDGISIDGSTQPGSVCNTLSAGVPHDLRIYINGSGSGGATVIRPAANDVTVKGIAVGNASSKGLFLNSSHTNLRIECSYWGVQPDGITSAPLGKSALNATNQINGGSGHTVTNSLFSGNNDDANDTGFVISNTSNVTVTGNVFGLRADGTAALPNGLAGLGISNATNVTIGGATAAERNILSGNGDYGIDLDTVSSITILGNYIGTNAAGTAARANGVDGVIIEDGTSITIGNGTAGGRNMIGGNGGRAIYVTGTSSSIAISGNYIGTDATGNVALTNGQNLGPGQRDAINFFLGTITNTTIADNIIGGYDASGIKFYDMSSGSGNVVTGNSIGVGADGTTDITNGNKFSEAGVFIGSEAGTVALDVVLGGTGAGEGNLIANGNNNGIWVKYRRGVTVIGNTLRDNGGAGVAVTGDGEAAIYNNNIYDNGGLGIDMNDDGVTDNDSGDNDSGSNDLLNFPVINSISAVGTTIYYDFDLDTASNLEGYRIDFYSNSAADASLHGEGETHLGFIDISHTGGDLNFTGDFVSTETIAEGTIISATTTRKTGGSTYDVTSEFSLNYTSEAAASLTAAKSVSVFDPTAAGLYALPGNDIISSMLVTNAGSGAADADTIVIIDEVPSEMIFYNGDMDDGGPATNPVYFTQTGGAGLTFTYGTDAAYSDSMTRPTNMAGCNYTPSAGYDSNVTYVCFNPKGAMASGDPDPTFTVQFRARIK